MSCQIHEDEIGTRFLITVKDCQSGSGIDVTTALYKQLNFRKPSDTIITRSASTFTDGSAQSGVIYYDTVAGDFDEPGLYKLQGKISFPSGTYYTDIYSFKVNCNL